MQSKQKKCPPKYVHILWFICHPKILRINRSNIRKKKYLKFQWSIVFSPSKERKLWGRLFDETTKKSNEKI